MPKILHPGRSIWRVVTSIALLLAAVPRVSAAAAGSLDSAAVRPDSLPALAPPALPAPDPVFTPAAPGGELVTDVTTSGVGRIAVRVEPPLRHATQKARPS